LSWHVNEEVTLCSDEASQGCVVPTHHELKTGTLAGVLKQAGVTVEDFVAALR
jgi:hypothetical protein